MKSRKLKMMPLEWWMVDIDEMDMQQYRISTDIEPVGINGQYFDRLNDLWWFEVAGVVYASAGKEYGKESFIYSLHIANQKILSDAEEKAMKLIASYSSDAKLKKELRRVMQDSGEAKQLRDSYRDARKRVMVMLNTFEGDPYD